MSKRGKGRPKKIESSHKLSVSEFGEANCFDENQPAAEFFQIYFSTSCSQRLRIPPSFMKNFDGYIPSIFTLKTPPGTMSWLVDPEKINADWYLQKGWPQFVQDNSLTHGDFLTFSYDGKSTFYVKVFATNGCRKISTSEAERLQGNVKASKRGRSGKGVRRRITSPSKPCSQEFFKVVLPQRLASKKLLIPPDYIKHFHRTMPERIILKDEGGKSWHVSVEERRDGVYVGSTGWQSFVNDKCLGVGDFLVFCYNGLYSFSVKTFGTDGCMKGSLDATKSDTIRVKIEKEDVAEAAVVKHALAFNEDECPRESLDAEKKAMDLEIGKEHVAEQNVAKRARIVKENDDFLSPTAITKLSTGANEIGEEDVVMIDDEPEETEGMVFACPGELIGKNVASETRNGCKDSAVKDHGIPTRPCFVSSPVKSRNSGRVPGNVKIPKDIISRQGVRLLPEMVLCDSKGREWPVNVYRLNDGRWYIGSGWTKFRRENNMALTDQCEFKFDTVRFSNQIDVQILCPRRKNRR